MTPRPKSQGWVQTRVTSRWKLRAPPGQLSAEINSPNEYLETIMMEKNNPGAEIIFSALEVIEEHAGYMHFLSMDFSLKNYTDHYIPDTATLEYINLKFNEFVQMLNSAVHEVQESIDEFVLCAEKAKLASEPAYAKLVSAAHRRTAQNTRTARKVRKIAASFANEASSDFSLAQSKTENRKAV